MSNNDGETPTYEQPYDSLPTLPPSPGIAPLEQKEKAKIEIERGLVFIDKYSETSTNYTTTGAGGTSTDHLVSLELIEGSIQRLQSYTDDELVILSTGRYFIQFSVTPYFIDNVQLVSPWIRVTHLDTTTETVCGCELATYLSTTHLNDRHNCLPAVCQRVFYFEKGEKIEVFVRVTTSTASGASGRALFSGNRRVNPHLTLHKLG